MDKLFEQFLKLLQETDTDFFRYIYAEINWKSRMIGLTGPRGVGKTTLVLQHIKRNLNPAETLYVTAEDFYFADNKLIDLADTFVKSGGKYLFVDESGDHSLLPNKIDPSFPYGCRSRRGLEQRWRNRY